MIKKKLLNSKRLRRIDGGFSFIPHRFLTDGFLAYLSQRELLLYLFLILVSDRHGLSYYAYDSICSLLQFSLDDYIEARDGLMEKDLIAFDGKVFQVLSLPEKVVDTSRKLLKNPEEIKRHDPATIHQLAVHSLGENHG